MRQHGADLTCSTFPLCHPPENQLAIQVERDQSQHLPTVLLGELLRICEDGVGLIERPPARQRVLRAAEQRLIRKYILRACVRRFSCVLRSAFLSTLCGDTNCARSKKNKGKKSSSGSPGGTQARARVGDRPCYPGRMFWLQACESGRVRVGQLCPHESTHPSVVTSARIESNVRPRTTKGRPLPLQASAHGN